MADSKPKIPTIILGTSNIGNAKADAQVRFDTPEQVNALLDTFYNRGYRVLDTARQYPPFDQGSCEPRIGLANKAKKGDDDTTSSDGQGRFIINTKVFSLTPGDHRAENIARSVDGSLAALDIPQVNVEFLHCPERTTPFAETVAAMDAQKRAGKFRVFGISNFRVNDVKQLLDIAHEGGYVAPQVYQGCYNAVTRDIEAELLPLLRKNNIAFHAYSPTAGGLFSDRAKAAKPGDRYHPDHPYNAAYGPKYSKPAIEEAVDRVRVVAKEHGISGHDASLRWTVYHSALSADHGDAVILGASSVKQLEQNLDAIEAGPLPKAVVDAINDIANKLSDGDKEGFYY